MNLRRLLHHPRLAARWALAASRAAAPYVAVGIVLFAVGLGAVRGLVGMLPAQHARLEAWASKQVGHRLTVDRIRFGWSGWNPELCLDGLTVFGASGEKALGLARVGLRLDLLRSLREWAPRLGSAAVDGLGLTIVRDADGALVLRGLGGGGEDAGLAAILLRSEAVVELRDSEVTWVDEGRGLAPVLLTGVQLRVQNDGDHHSIRASADLPSGRARLALDADGDLLGSQWQGHSYVEAQGLYLARWVGRSLAPLTTHGGSAQLELWTQWRDARPQGASGSFAVHSTALEWAGQSLYLQEARGRVRLERVEDGWHAALADYSLQTDRLTLTGGAIEARVAGRWPEWQVLVHAPSAAIRAARPDIPAVGSVPAAHLSAGAPPGEDAPGPGVARGLQWLLSASPRAGLRDLWVRRDPARPGGVAWSAAWQFEGASLQPSDRLPGVRGLAGLARLWDARGEVQLTAGPVVLEWPAGYTEPVVLESVAGPVEWDVAGAPGWRVSTPGLTLSTADFRLALAGSARGAGAEAGRAYLSLVASSDGLPLPRLAAYLPDRVMKARTVQWLSHAFEQGDARRVDLLLHGPLSRFPYGKGEGRFEVRVDVDDVALRYEPRWPVLTQCHGLVGFDGPRVRIDLARARVYDAPVTSAWGEIDDLSSEFPWLHVEARGEPSGADASRFIRESPLDPAAKNRFGDVTVDGTLGLKLTLDVPLAHDDPQDTRFAGTVTFRGNRAVLRRAIFTGASGDLTFDREQFAARGLRAQMGEVPVTLSVEPGASNGQPTTRLRVAGSVSVEQLARSLSAQATAEGLWPVVRPRLRGTAKWEATADVAAAAGSGPGAVRLVVESDLRGLEVSLPAPLKKGAQERRALRVESTLGPTTIQTVRVRLGDQLSAGLAFGPSAAQPAVQGVDVRVGPGAGTPADPAAPGLRVSGSLPELAVAPWLELAEAFETPRVQRKGTRSAVDGLALERIDLNVGRLVLGEFEVEKTRLGVQAQPRGGLQVSLEGKGAAGTVTVPPGGDDAPIAASFERLALQTSSVKGTPVQLPDPQGLPAIDASCKDLHVDARALGSLVLTTGPTPGGIALRTLRLEGPELVAEATGDWTGAGNRQGSRLDASLKSPDLGRFLRTLGYDESGIEGGRTRLQVQARWPGSPAAFALSAVRGEVTLKVRDGTLIDVSPGAGRVFGLLSVQALPRRLTLDFRDLFGKGFRYRSIDGTFRLEGGNAHTEDLVVEGNAARIDIRGRVGLAAEDYDQRVTVLPRLSTTLPIAGVLAGGPIGAVAGLVAGQVFKDQIDRVAQVEYTVKGPWTDPVVERVGAAAGPPHQ